MVCFNAVGIIVKNCQVHMAFYPPKYLFWQEDFGGIVYASIHRPILFASICMEQDYRLNAEWLVNHLK